MGGPIIKDKIWFFGFYQGKNDSSSLWQADPDYPARFQGNEQFIKFTLQPASKHRLVLSFDRQFSFWPAEHGVDAWNMPESVGAQTVPTYSWNAHYTFFSKRKYVL